MVGVVYPTISYLKKNSMVNSYNIFNESNRVAGCVAVEYYAIASDEYEVLELAYEAGYDLSGMTIQLSREDVRDPLGRPYKPRISKEW